MKTHFLRHAVIALLALVSFLPGGVEAGDPNATAALSPPSKPLGDPAIPNNNLAPRVVLYEETPSDPQGTRAVGSVVWSTEMLSPGIGKAAEPAVRAQIDIPDRKMEINWSLRRTPDLPTSHSLEFLFKLPADFCCGGIHSVPGFWMKERERARGIPLTGTAVKVKTGYFLIGLSAAPADLEHNLPLLKDGAWIDVPIVYTNNRRAILAVEKGTPGEQAFRQVFAAWKE